MLPMRRMFADKRIDHAMPDEYIRSYRRSYISVNESFRSRYIPYLLSLKDCVLRSGKSIGYEDAYLRIGAQRWLCKFSCLCALGRVSSIVINLWLRHLLVALAILTRQVFLVSLPLLILCAYAL